MSDQPDPTATPSATDLAELTGIQGYTEPVAPDELTIEADWQADTDQPFHIYAHARLAEIQRGLSAQGLILMDRRILQTAICSNCAGTGLDLATSADCAECEGVGTKVRIIATALDLGPTMANAYRTARQNAA